MGPKEDCCIGSIPLQWSLTAFYATCILKLWFFRNHLTWNKCHWIWHASNPKYVQLKPFWYIFPSQNQQNVKFLAVCWTPPWEKMNLKKDINLNREKVFEKAWTLSAHIGFWCIFAITMHYVITLCDKYFWSYLLGFSWQNLLTERFNLNRVFETYCRGRMGCKEDCCIGPMPVCNGF